MRGTRGDGERLHDILEAINAIRSHITSRSQLDDMLTATAATHWIEVIGEAVNALSSEVRDAHAEVAWVDAVRMRNRLIHGYFDVDADLLWDTVDRDIPTLESQIRAILEARPE